MAPGTNKANAASIAAVLNIFPLTCASLTFAIRYDAGRVVLRFDPIIIFDIG
jgi:hypothetical protein